MDESATNVEEEVPSALENPEPPVTIRKRDLMESMRCPVCVELITPQIFSCQNGHHLCNICWEQISLCPQCQAPKGARNIFAEQFIESHVDLCQNSSNGCRANYWKEDSAQLQSHESNCKYRNLYCWIPNCPSRHIGMEALTLHWETQHGINQTEADEESLVIPIDPNTAYQSCQMHLKRDGNSFLGIIEVCMKNMNQVSCLAYVYGYSPQDCYKYTVTMKYQELTGTRTESWTGSVHHESLTPADISRQEMFYHTTPVIAGIPDEPVDIHIKISVWAAPAVRSRQSSMQNDAT